MGGSKGSHRSHVWVTGVVALVLIVTGATLYVLQSGGPPSFSRVVYPRPVPAKKSSVLTECPNPTGLTAFTTTTSARALRATSQMALGGQRATQQMTDPSFWSSLATLNPRSVVTPSPQYRRQEVVKGIPSAPGASIVAASCGEELLAKTQVIYAMPITSMGARTNCNDCTAHYYFIDRRGHALLYWVF